MSAAAAYAGGCLCGGLRFRVVGPALWSAHCHCSRCQKAHGAAFVTWVGVAEDRASIEDEEGNLLWYRSSPEAERGFCRRCGSTLFFRSTRWPGELHIVRANFDGDLDREPSAHVFWDTHASWIEAAESLPKMPG